MDVKEIFKDLFFHCRGKDRYVQSGWESFCGEQSTDEISSDLSKYIYGQSIVNIIEDEDGEVLRLVLSNGVELEVQSNEGCGGCGNGWYLYSEVIDTGTKGNVITKVEVEQPEDCEDGTYSLYIYSNDKRILQTDFTGGDNGYYGVGINMRVRMTEETLMKLIDKENI